MNIVNAGSSAPFFWLCALCLGILLGGIATTAGAQGYELFQTLEHVETGFESLDDVQAAALSPDGRHLYVGGLDAILVMERDDVSGGLTPIQTLKTDRDGLGILFIHRLVISPDGLNLYAGSSVSDAVVVVARNPADGRLTVVQSLFHGDPLVAGLLDLADLDISSDGDYVYTLSTSRIEVGVFTRAAGDGSLAFASVVDTLRQPELRLPTTLAVSPEGNQVVVGDALSGLLVFEQDADDDGLSLASLFPSGASAVVRPLDLIFAPDGDHLYVAGQDFGQQPVLSSLARNPDGTLSRIQTLSGLATAEGLVMDAEGSHLYLTGDDQVTVMSRSPQGQLTQVQQLLQGMDGIEGLGGSNLGVLDTQRRHLYVPAVEDEAIAIFERQSDGRLTFQDAVFDDEGSTVDGLRNIVGLHATRDGSDVYTLGGANRVLAQFHRSADGRLQAGPIFSLVDVGLLPFLPVQRLLVTPTDSHLIVLDTFAQAWIFRRGEGGQLEFLTKHVFETLFPERMVFDPQSRFVFATSLLGMQLFEFDPNSGRLTPVSHSVEGNRAFQRIAIDPEGRFLFGGQSESLGDAGPSVIHTYRWNASERRLIQIASRTHASFGDQLTGLAVSPDGRHVITTGRGTPEAGLSVFEVHPQNGVLTHLQTLGPSVGTVGLNGPTLGSIDPSGTRLVAVDNVPLNRTSSFLKRDPSTGLLEILEQRTNGPPSFLDDVRLTWSPNGRQFYVTSPVSDSLYAFEEPRQEPTCTPGPQVLCLGADGRFQVEVEWTDFTGQQGAGTKVTESGDSGLFWFFDPANWEMLVKVIDGCDFNGHHWVFAAATTNVAYTLTVTDTVRGVEAIYQNPLGISSAAITDTEALNSCP